MKKQRKKSRIFIKYLNETFFFSMPVLYVFDFHQLTMNQGFQKHTCAFERQGTDTIPDL